MGMKKKLSLGVASAALGLALVGGGTWAAFNDVKSTDATFASGTLDLSAKEQSANVNLSNLKPGDKLTKDFEFRNNGSLAIKEVLMALNFTDFKGAKKGNESAEDFLSQFEITVLTVGKEGGNGYPKNIILKAASLKDLYLMSAKQDKAAAEAISKHIDPKFLSESGKVNVATINGKTAPEYDGVPKTPVDYDQVRMEIRFKNDTAKDANGLSVQNKFQGNAISLQFSFEATQWNGLTITKDHTDKDGYVKENEKAHSEDKN
ncbi:TasA family protein [Bacillus sp. L381]|jgi:spore coat-associated protein N|uniref:Major biofilm matrix component n=3 Tax=Bacillus amyloliquefaciens TaxID=1390 RepID=A0A9P1NHZ3_BACAS|nr:MULTISPECIES: TasA family protein [Bacillus]AIW34411.1 spore coat protein [Bacillus subtilis]AEB24694.1 major biofilm matrix component [Bacillus amyloliquefaciens TA208]AEB64192.1 major biofilm matrix component [Bacillus amyloliquefaciens LL3]AEK89710.1 camelysin metallo-endopeptidase [Bacillus amyloliquefaciens XH7]ARW39632.1 Spore coat-associated protein [Bacillus amyloliquefaciens]